jgi:hypothetical protein
MVTSLIRFATCAAINHCCEAYNGRSASSVVRKLSTPERKRITGIRGAQGMLGGHNVRPLRQQVRWQSGRKLGQHLVVRVSAGWQVGGQRLADQQHQRILVLRHLAGVLRQVRPRRRDRGLGLAQCQRRRASSW